MRGLYQSAAELVGALKKGAGYRVAAGFDGFVDYLARPILRESAGGREYFPTIASFGEYLVGKASMSCSIELETVMEKIGGNMPIYAQALAALGVGCDCIGAVGYPEMKDIFAPLSRQVSLTGVSNPGSCTALEFSDGKVMLARNNGVDRLDYDLLVGLLGADRLRGWIADAHAVALLNWSETRGASSIWRGLLEHILPGLGDLSGKLMLLDISDCSRRGAEDVREMAELAARFSERFRVVFSMNRNEAISICGAFSIQAPEVSRAAELILEKTGVSGIVVHMLDSAFALDREGGAFVPGKQVESPTITTGGGDNFNAGLTLGLLGGLACPQAAALANAAGGFYVANGRSASAAELLEFIHQQY